MDPRDLQVTQNAYFPLIAHTKLILLQESELVFGHTGGQTEGQTEVEVEIVI